MITIRWFSEASKLLVVRLFFAALALGFLGTTAHSQSFEDLNEKSFVKDWLNSLPALKLGERPVLPQALKPRRRALVIGNWKYKNIPSLNGVQNDFNGIQKLLSSKKYGFDVTPFTNISNLDEYGSIFPSFARTVKENDFVVIYYSGHGLHYDGGNYLLPIEIPKKIKKENLLSEAVSLQRLIEDIWFFNPGYVVVVFDACRTVESFKIDDEKAMTKGGYNNFDKPANLVSYPNTEFWFASKSGYPANAPLSDDGYSIFTEGLIKKIAPEKTLEKIATQTRAYVENRTLPKQYPARKTWTSTITKLIKDKRDYTDDLQIWLTTLEGIITTAKSGQSGVAATDLNDYISMNSTSPYLVQAKYIKNKRLLRRTPQDPSLNFLIKNNVEIIKLPAVPMRGDVVYTADVAPDDLIDISKYAAIDGYTIDVALRKVIVSDSNSNSLSDKSFIDKVLSRFKEEETELRFDPVIRRDGDNKTSTVPFLNEIGKETGGETIRILIENSNGSTINDAPLLVPKSVLKRLERNPNVNLKMRESQIQ